MARSAVSGKVLDWLLEEEQPSIRYLALTTLFGKPEHDPAVRSAKAAIPQRGWAVEILARQHPDGWWDNEKCLYRTKYLATNWMLLALADLGLTREDRRIDTACRLWIRRFARADGGFNTDNASTSHLCVTGNMARALVQFGYSDLPRVESAFRWLAASADPLGGWNCFGKGRNLDSWEAMSAFAVYPRDRWTAAMTRAVERGGEYYLSKALHRQGARYEPWFRLHDPVHYYYDLLVGLEFMTALGYGGDPRLGEALAWLRGRQRRDGRFPLDAVHPDLEGAMLAWYNRNPRRTPRPFALERPGRPSKRITLRALAVLRRVDEVSA